MRWQSMQHAAAAKCCGCPLPAPGLVKSPRQDQESTGSQGPRKSSQKRGAHPRGTGGVGRWTIPSFCVWGQSTYSHQHKGQQDRGSHRYLSPGSDRTHGDKTGTVLGSCPGRSHILYGIVDSVLLLCPQSSPRGTRSHTSCGTKSR